MADMMTFPDTVEEFMEQYKITDTEHIYTNGTELVPIFRMKQWFDHKPEPLNREIQPEIIRCKDCKYWRMDLEGERYCACIVGVLGCDDGSGYCSDAERR